MDLDRLTPARRESCRTFKTGRQSWRDLLFVHWEIPVKTLQAMLPSALTVDTFEGRAYVGVVPFTMRGTRFGVLDLEDFLEVNVRTYVHAERVPGVWFFSLDAESALAVMGGRMFFSLSYFRARMTCTKDGRSVAYTSARRGPGSLGLDARWSWGDEPSFHAAPGTLEHFLTERYTLYGPQGAQGVYRLRVHHPPWPLRRGTLARLDTTLLSPVGITTAAPIDLVLATPEGVSVETFKSERVP